jgi:hypothetical protein
MLSMQWDVHLEVAPFVVRPQEKRARSELGMQDGLNIYFMQCVEDECCEDDAMGRVTVM